MAAVLELGCDSQTVATSLTRYLTEGDTRIGSNTNEIDAEYTRASPGVLSGMYVRITANTVTASTSVVSRINRVNGAQTLSIGSSATGAFQDTTHSDAVVAGDRFDAAITTGGTGTNITLSLLGFLFAATNDTVKRYTTSPSSQWPITTAIAYFTLGGGSSTAAGATDELRVQTKISTPGKVQNLYSYVVSNTSSGTMTATVRKNAVTGNGVLSIASAATGVFEDLVNVDVVAAGDLLTVSGILAAASTGQANPRRFGVEFLSTGSATHALASNIAATVVLKSVTTFYAWSGHLVTSTTEANVQALAQGAFTVSKLGIYLVTNTVTATSTLRFRKNTANGSQSVSLTASTSGYFEDAANTDTVIATDLTAISLVTGGTGTSLAPSMIQSMVQALVGAANPPTLEPLGDILQPFLAQ